MSINKVVISGNLTRDPELRQTANGFPVLGFGVAVNDRRRNQQTGEWGKVQWEGNQNPPEGFQDVRIRRHGSTWRKRNASDAPEVEGRKNQENILYF